MNDRPDHSPLPLKLYLDTQFCLAYHVAEDEESDTERSAPPDLAIGAG